MKSFRNRKIKAQHANYGAHISYQELVLIPNFKSATQKQKLPENVCSHMRGNQISLPPLLMSLAQVIRQHARSITYVLLTGLVPLTASSLLTYYAIRYEPAIRQFEWPQWVLFYLGTCLTMGFALTPTTFIALLSGYFLGWKSLPYICVAYVCASWIGYRVATWLDQGAFMRNIEDKNGVKQFIERFKTGEWGVVISARLSPVLPFAVMNVLLAMLKVDLKKYIWGGFIGMLPRTTLAIFAGTQAKAIRALLEDPGDQALAQLILILLTLGSLAGIRYFVIRALNKKSLPKKP
jgi:uncharacterized membrane protein YdjX (TVP38/TMEM64 family)